MSLMVDGWHEDFGVAESWLKRTIRTTCIGVRNSVPKSNLLLLMVSRAAKNDLFRTIENLDIAPTLTLSQKEPVDANGHTKHAAWDYCA